jgi:hypothetical protein
LINDKLYVFGGEDITGPKDEMFVFDLKTFTWEKINQFGSIPSKRTDMAYSIIPPDALDEGINE